MEKTVYNEPRLAINRVYTRTGDSGQTGLVGGQRVPKDSLRIECYGTVDELNSFVGIARHSAEESVESYQALEKLVSILRRIQHELFNLGSILATKPEDVHPRQPRVTEVEVALLETEMDEMTLSLPPLRSFVLPGGCRLNAELHACRTICRRAERICVALARQEEVGSDAIRYLNRLSDAFFVWSRWASLIVGAPETLWEPNRSASGSAE